MMLSPGVQHARRLTELVDRRDDDLPRTLAQQRLQFLAAVVHVRIVLDDEHAQRLSGRPVTRWKSGTRTFRTANQRQADDKFAAFAKPVTIRDHRTSVQLDETLDERQADAEPAFLARERALALHEQIEDARKQLGRDAAPVVAHAEPCGVVVTGNLTSIRPPFGVYLIALPRRFDTTCASRVESARTSVSPSGSLQHELVSARRGKRAHRIGGLAHDLRKIERARARARSARS